LTIQCGLLNWKKCLATQIGGGAEEMKVTVIGGGSSYTPELINGFLERVDQFPLSELWLMDVLPERLQVVGGFAQRMVEAKGAPFSVHLTTNRREALRGASYVTTQLRVGWMQARREDEYLGLRHGLIGQETTGVGGMAKALRTIPVILGIAEDMRDLAPPIRRDWSLKLWRGMLLTCLQLAFAMCRSRPRCVFWIVCRLRVGKTSRLTGLS
jgi:hypothetical protein